MMVRKCVVGGLMVVACVLGSALYLRLEKLGKENRETIAQLRTALTEQRHILETTQDQLRTFVTGERKPEETLAPAYPDSHGAALFDVEHLSLESSEWSERPGERTRRFTIADVFYRSYQKDLEKWDEEEKLDNEEEIIKWYLKGELVSWRPPEGNSVRWIMPIR